MIVAGNLTVFWKAVGLAEFDRPLPRYSEELESPRNPALGDRELLETLYPKGSIPNQVLI